VGIDRIEQARAVFAKWYESLPTYSSSGGGPARGTIGAALVVLDRLKDDFNLSLSAHRAPGGSQIQGAGVAAVTEILARFGEQRPFLREGGRTNRGGPGDIGRMLEALGELRLETCSARERARILDALQSFLVDRVRVRDLHNRQRLTFTFDFTKTSWQIVRELLDRARDNGKEGPVAQYLVGAKLQLRYPDIEVENFSSSMSDVQQGRPGDFLLSVTAFHVTVAPMAGLFEKCRANIHDGYRVYVIVPDRSVVGTRQNAEGVEPGKIFVGSIEAFVGGNIDQMSRFDRASTIAQFRSLLEVYNRRVDEVENDKSMLIEIPAPLR
jgi:hypothetical protein